MHINPPPMVVNLLALVRLSFFFVTEQYMLMHFLLIIETKAKKAPSSSEYALIISILKDGNTMEDVTDCFHN